MDESDDSDDYELMPKRELMHLRQEISALKRNPYAESDKGRDLQESMDRLNNAINKLISILEDAQQDIIDEYQASKPLEKLNQILDQNETIAKALINVNEKMSGGPIVADRPQIPRPAENLSSIPSNFQNMSPPPKSFQQPMTPQNFNQPPVQTFNQPAFQPMNNFNQPMSPPDFSTLPPLDSLDNLPPLDVQKKKKFLGVI
ncbi:hypothetical protein J4399_07550 [Candidatus Woesearchaeota archaeon]|nr:hypothetical protein [Candidatus Woesearchaeota archaeon]HIH54892.1 hypothetical protein [Candidatus Woesearchaeota archaeon]HIJ01749.1 hypothetical protein [Candidatus Woesearchaeota archaeon]HIJ13937.1 hypothetical protein [Candidatus Woesearchaeota archaeon]